MNLALVIVLFFLFAIDTRAAKEKSFESTYQTHSAVLPKDLENSGKVIIMHFWATWCPPCKNEMAKLDLLAGKLDANKFKIIPFANDRHYTNTVPAFYAKHNITNLEVLGDIGAIYAKQLKVTGLPTTIIIDTRGKVIGKLEGAVDWLDPKALEYLNKIFNGDKKVG